MSFLSKLFGSETPPRPEVYHAAIDLITVSEGLQTQLKTAVQQAFDQPESFYHNGKYTLANRGLMAPQSLPLTPKFVLVDTLIDHEQMAEVDWKEAEEDIRCAIYNIMDAKNFPLRLLGDDHYPDLNTFSIIKAIDREELQPAGYCLCMLDINSDSYVFTIAPLNQQAAVEQLFTQLK